ncbi:MarR family transcriptional regulator [Nocardia takedensis]
MLQTAKLKGRPNQADLLAVGGPDAVAALIDSGALVRAGTRLKLTAIGRAELGKLLAAERGTVDQDVLNSVYHETFGPLNTRFKQLVTDWQLIDGVRFNDHSDTAYDAAIVARLGELHQKLVSLIDQLAVLAPRLSGYGPRFSAALDKVQAGDHSWLARPMTDSYHTVWFELHEDLIGLAGLSRVQEAAAGRAE